MLLRCIWAHNQKNFRLKPLNNINVALARKSSQRNFISSNGFKYDIVDYYSLCVDNRGL